MGVTIHYLFRMPLYLKGTFKILQHHKIQKILSGNIVRYWYFGGFESVLLKIMNGDLPNYYFIFSKKNIQRLSSDQRHLLHVIPACHY